MLVKEDGLREVNLLKQRKVSRTRDLRGQPILVLKLDLEVRLQVRRSSKENFKSQETQTPISKMIKFTLIFEH